MKDSLWGPRGIPLHMRQQGWIWRDDVIFRLKQKKIIADLLGRWPKLRPRLQYLYCDIGGWADMFYVPRRALQKWASFGVSLIAAMDKQDLRLLNEIAVPWIHIAVAEMLWQDYRKSVGSPMFIEDVVGEGKLVPQERYAAQILTGGIQAPTCAGSCCHSFSGHLSSF